MTLIAQNSWAEWLKPRLAGYTRILEDEFGSFYAYFEGAVGGETVLLWAASTDADGVLAALPLAFKGRIVLGLDASPGHAAPFARALYWASPRLALIVGEGEGIVSSFPGAKAVAEGEWVAWDDPREAKRLEVKVRPDFSYHEALTYAPWQAPLPGQAAERDNRTPPSPQSRFRTAGVGYELGIPVYGVGLIGLEGSLRTLLGAWKLL